MEDLPPGFRFFPTEEELVSFYLRSKLEGTRQALLGLFHRVIPVLDIYEFNPSDLPRRAPNGVKTEWKMNEYNAIEGEDSSPEEIPVVPTHEFSVCRVYKKTKTLRSFDRRPMGEIIRSRHAFLPNTMPDDDRRPQEMTSSHWSSPPFTERASSSPNSSGTSGDHGTIPSQAGGLGSSTDMEMLPRDSELFLQDWEQLWS
ncbi:hypothetical protein NL676_016582 [Syzygium grande]|nr:hypothetical protein NL676_016582 [Syzygium grande]